MDIPRKIINLILYSSGDECYEMMAEILTAYLQAKKVEHYFYSYKPDLEEDYVIHGNHLVIKGVETMMPGVLEKTLRALEIFRDYDYDFIVRTNVSTIVDFDIALDDITPDCDFAGFMFNGWGTMRFAPHGVTDENHAKYHTHTWPTGVFVVFSRKAVEMMIKDKAIIHAYGTIDDRAVGSYFHERLAQISRSSLDWSKTITNATKKMPGVIAYRNKSDGNRALDVCRMKLITRQLLTQDV